MNLSVGLSDRPTQYSALNFIVPDIFQNLGTVSGLFHDYYLTQTFPSVGLTNSGATIILTKSVSRC